MLLTYVSVSSAGFVAVLVTLAVVPFCLYMDYNILVLYSKYRHLMATFLSLSVLLSLALYIKGRYAAKDALNPAGNTGCFLPDLFQGREVAPVVLSLDLKFVLLRIACLSMVSVCYCYISNLSLLLLSHTFLCLLLSFKPLISTLLYKNLNFTYDIVLLTSSLLGYMLKKKITKHSGVNNA